jgi:predicted amidohydrolase YtcJ
MRFFIFLILFVPTTLAQSPPDLIIINADVRTMDKANPRAEAIAIAGGRISAVGTTDDIKKLAGESTRTIDAQGKLVLPGFNDAHAHTIALGNQFSSIDLSDAKTADDVVTKFRPFADFLPKGRWILGGKLDPAIELTLAQIDAAAPENPVFVFHNDPKSALANTLALTAAKVEDKTGVVSETQLDSIRRVVPQDHVRDLAAIVETASNYAASLGITSIQDMHSDDLAAVLQALAREGKLKTRVYDCVSMANWAKLAVVGTKAAEGDAMVRTGCVKGHYDEEDEATASLGRYIAGADSAGLQVMIHAIGPKANQIVLAEMEKAIKANGARDRRFRIEHSSGLRPIDVRRFARSKIIPSMQPILFFSEGSGSTDDYRRLLDSGAQIALGADAPMRGLNPLEGIHAAVNAGGKRGLTLEEAVHAYTMGAAFAEFQEKEKGSIETGKLADLVILSSDIFAEKADIRSATVTMTFVNGRLVYENKN